MRKAERSVSSKVTSSLVCIHGQVTKHTTVKWPILYTVDKEAEMIDVHQNLTVLFRLVFTLKVACEIS